MNGRLRQQSSTIILATVVLGIVSVLIVPLPPLVLDILFAVDLLFAGLVLVTSIVIREPIEFAAFAPILLVATLFRLSLDVSATRLILTQAEKPGGVGELIPAFGAFVVHGNVVVGVIVFAILTTIQFVVIASGAGRVAEVAARFTLDALPGKQMAIDAELHAGAIDSATAKLRRGRVQREADFFGAMDGAGKFIKGDAVAALVIVVLNLIGGFIIGVFMHGQTFEVALNTYVISSIGNALLTTLPSFLLSTAMGLLVTRVTADGSLGADVVAQLLGRPMVLRIGGSFALLLACVPALPHLIFLLLGLGLFGLAVLATQRIGQTEQQEKTQLEARRRSNLRRPEAALARIGVDPITISFGKNLLGFCSGDQGEAFLDRIAEIRRVLAGELGIVLPGIRLRDRLDGDPSVYSIAVRGEVVAAGRLRHDALFILAEPTILERFGNDIMHDPVYGLTGRAIAPDQRAAALELGALVFDPTTMITSHLSEVARNHAAKLLGRQEFQTLLDHLRISAPAVVKDIIGERIGMSLALRIFQGLLEEKIWPRDVIASLEAIIDLQANGHDERAMTSTLRARLVPLQLKRSGTKLLAPLLLDPAFEQKVREAWQSVPGASQADPRMFVQLRDEILAYSKNVIRAQAALLCSGAIRSEMARFVQRLSIDLPVYAFSEVPGDIELKPMVIVGKAALEQAVEVYQ